MPNKTAAALMLREGDRPRLEALIRSNTVAAGVAQRARIVLLAAEGLPNYEIAERVGVTRPTVNLWRNRYATRGLAGLDGVRPPGRPRSVDRANVITATLTPPPQSLGVTHWSSRLLADRLGIEHSTVAAIWKEYGVRPWKAETFKLIRNAPNH
jgi:transposase